MLFYTTASSSSPLGQQNKTLSSKKQQSPPIQPSHKPPPIPIYSSDVINATYESLDNGDPVDYTYPKASPTNLTNSSSNTYTYIPISFGKDKFGRSEISDEDTLYHAVGPNVRGWTRTDVPGIGSTPLPTFSPPVLSRNDGYEGLYYMLDGELKNLSVHYEDPTLPKFRVRMF